VKRSYNRIELRGLAPFFCGGCGTTLGWGEPDPMATLAFCQTCAEKTVQTVSDDEPEVP